MTSGDPVLSSETVDAQIQFLHKHNDVKKTTNQTNKQSININDELLQSYNICLIWWWNFSSHTPTASLDRRVPAQICSPPKWHGSLG